MKQNLLSLIGTLSLGYVKNFAVDSGAGFVSEVEFGKPLEESNVVTSRVEGKPRRHKVLLDIDHPAWLIPSTNPNHSHLYIDVECSETDYFDLLDVLARCQVIEPGYAGASKRRKGTTLRLPWVQKDKPTTPASRPTDKECDPWL